MTHSITLFADQRPLRTFHVFYTTSWYIKRFHFSFYSKKKIADESGQWYVIVILPHSPSYKDCIWILSLNTVILIYRYIIQIYILIYWYIHYQFVIIENDFFLDGSSTRVEEVVTLSINCLQLGHFITEKINYT